METGQETLRRSASKNSASRKSGVFAAFAAYGCWGLFPLYWKQLVSVDALQILMHRIVWAALFCLILLTARGDIKKVRAVFRDRKTLFLMICAAFAVTVNWGVYIWVVNIGHIMESSLGYYINPLMSVALGAIFFREKIDRWTRIAVFIAAASIVGAAVIYGSVPWISLFLAATFASYGALKKRAALEPLVSLAVETCIVMPLAIVWLARAHLAGTGAFWNAGPRITVLLALAGLVTAIPLLFFAKAANNIPLQLMGFTQYLAPTLQFLIGFLVFGEQPGPPLILAFCGVIAAAAIYSFTRPRNTIP